MTVETAPRPSLHPLVMKLRRVLPVVAFATLFLKPAMAGTSLKVGDAAPDFALADQNGQTIRLRDFRGKKSVVLAFYLRASTPG